MLKLNDNYLIPNSGFGAMIYDDVATKKAVSQALMSGYRLIDTAKAYGTQKGVGQAINQSPVDRSDIFLTSKLWPDQSTNYDTVVKQFRESLQELDQEYLDLYLIHEPYGDISGEWRALEDLQEAGLIKSIGVSNFNQTQLDKLLQTAKVKPAINQIESHPFYNQNSLVEYDQKLGITTQAWASLGEGKQNIFHNQVLKSIADNHQKTVAQVVLRWDVQRGLIPLTKSEKIARLQENQAIFDFELNSGEIEQINQLDTGVSLYPGY